MASDGGVHAVGESSPSCDAVRVALDEASCVGSRLALSARAGGGDGGLYDALLQVVKDLARECYAGARLLKQTRKSQLRLYRGAS